jgi:hypothetical protein
MSAPAPEVPTWIGTAQHLRWLERILRAVLILNGVDAVLTLYWVGLGWAREGNPLVADLVTDHPVVFVLTKTTLVSLGSWLLWSLRRRPLAVVSIFAAFLAYYTLLLIHLQAVAHLHLG